MESLDAPENRRRPEAKLARLNHTLLRLLGAISASEFMRTNEVITVREILRNTILTEFLSQRMLFAVAGPQGAGKTTLVREVYGLDGTWLRANPGLGEGVPVLVVEDDVDSPQGIFWELSATGDETHLVSRDVPPPEWHSGARTLSDSVMVLELRVPMDFFGVRGMGILLLPGYEMGDEDLPWQELMRRVLVASPGAIVVTDEQLMATAQQERIVEDLRKLYRGAIRPTVCVSRTETLQSEERRRALRERAAGLFSVQSESVVLTGTGDAYLAQWRDQLLQTIGAEQDPSRSRPLQLQQLVRILDVDLRRVLTTLEGEAQVDDLLDDDSKYHSFLNLFDSSVAIARDDYNDQVSKALDVQLQAATELLRAYHNERGGWSNAMQTFTSWIQIRSSERKRAHDDAIFGCWNTAATSERGFPAVHSSIVRGLQWEIASSALTAAPAREGDQPSAAELEPRGSTSSDDRDVARDISGVVLPEFVLNDALFLAGAADPSLPGQLVQPSEHLDQSVRLLPASALEVLRLSLDVTSVQVDGSRITITEPEPADLTSTLEGIAANRKTLLKAGVAIFGLDVLANGSIDSIPALANSFHTLFFGPTAAAAGTAAGSGATAGGAAAGAAAGAAGALATAAAAAFVAAAAGAALLQYANTADRRDYARSLSLLAGARERAEEDLMDQFDVLMRQMRRRVDARLRGHLNVGASAVRRLRIRKAISDATEAMIAVLDDTHVQQALV